MDRQHQMHRHPLKHAASWTDTGVYILVWKQYSSPFRKLYFFPSHNMSFCYSYRALFAFVLSYFSFILPFYFLLSLIFLLSPLFLFHLLKFSSQITSTGAPPPPRGKAYFPKFRLLRRIWSITHPSNQRVSYIDIQQDTESPTDTQQTSSLVYSYPARQPARSTNVKQTSTSRTDIQLHRHPTRQTGSYIYNIYSQMHRHSASSHTAN